MSLSNTTILSCRTLAKDVTGTLLILGDPQRAGNTSHQSCGAMAEYDIKHVYAEQVLLRDTSDWLLSLARGTVYVSQFPQSRPSQSVCRPHGIGTREPVGFVGVECKKYVHLIF